MARRPKPRRKKTTWSTRAELRAYRLAVKELDARRLDREWTWLQLSKAMAIEGIEMSPRTLHYLVKRAPADAKPIDRTLTKLRRYLKLTAERQQPGQAVESTSASV